MKNHSKAIVCSLVLASTLSTVNHVNAMTRQLGQLATRTVPSLRRPCSALLGIKTCGSSREITSTSDCLNALLYVTRDWSPLIDGIKKREALRNNSDPVYLDDLIEELFNNKDSKEENQKPILATMIFNVAILTRSKQIDPRTLTSMLENTYMQYYLPNNVLIRALDFDSFNDESTQVLAKAILRRQMPHLPAETRKALEFLFANNSETR